MLLTKPLTPVPKFKPLLVNPLVKSPLLKVLIPVPKLVASPLLNVVPKLTVPTPVIPSQFGPKLWFKKRLSWV